MSFWHAGAGAAELGCRDDGVMRRPRLMIPFSAQGFLAGDAPAIPSDVRLSGLLHARRSRLYQVIRRRPRLKRFFLPGDSRLIPITPPPRRSGARCVDFIAAFISRWLLPFAPITCAVGRRITPLDWLIASRCRHYYLFSEMPSMTATGKEGGRSRDSLGSQPGRAAGISYAHHAMPADVITSRLSGPGRRCFAASSFCANNSFARYAGDA